jgi:hypothetical protein
LLNKKNKKNKKIKKRRRRRRGEMLGVPNVLPRDGYQDDMELIHWR